MNNEVLRRQGTPGTRPMTFDTRSTRSSSRFNSSERFGVKGLGQGLWGLGPWDLGSRVLGMGFI